MKTFTILGINFNWQSLAAYLPILALILENATGHPANEWNTLWQQGASLVLMIWGSVSAGNFKLTSTRALALVIALLTTAGPFFNIDAVSVMSNSKELFGLLATMIAMFGNHNAIVKGELNAQLKAIQNASKN